MSGGGFTRWDGVVWAVLLTILAALGGAIFLGGPVPDEVVGDGFEIRSLAGARTISAADTAVRVPGPAGGVLLVVAKGRARVVEASCPSGRCLRMGPISLATDPPIQCMPNAISVRAVGRGGARRRLDGITG